MVPARFVTCRFLFRSNRLGRRLNLFRRDQTGATAVEFALVSLPFFALVFAIIETAMGFWAGQIMENAVAAASRKIYTGEFQQANPTGTPTQLGTAFKNEVCNNVVALFDCASLVKVDVRSFAAFSNVSVPAPISNGQFDASSFGYQPVGPNQIVVVRAAMEYPVLVSVLKANTAPLSNGNRVIMGTAAFMTEPF